MTHRGLHVYTLDQALRRSLQESGVGTFRPRGSAGVIDATPGAYLFSVKIERGR